MQSEHVIASILGRKRGAGVRPREIGELPLPPSVHAFVARFGWLADVHNTLRVGPRTPMWRYTTRAMFEGALEEHRSYGSAVGACFGKVDDWQLVGTSARVHGAEWMWLWKGPDWAHDEGVAVAPLGATFDEAMLAALLGVHAALFCRAEIREKAVRKLGVIDAERAAAWRETLDRIDELNEELASEIWEVERYAPFEPEKIRARTAAVRAALPAAPYTPRPRVTWEGGDVAEGPALGEALKRAVMGLDHGDATGAAKLERLLDAAPDANVGALLERLHDYRPNNSGIRSPRHPNGMPIGVKGPHLVLYRMLVDRGARPDRLRAEQILEEADNRLLERENSFDDSASAIALYSQLWSVAQREGAWESALACKAAYAGSTALARALVDRGVDMNAAEGSGSTPLDMVVAGAQGEGMDKRSFVEVAKILVEGGAALNGPSGGSAALGMAVFNGNKEMMECLLALGANARLPISPMKLSTRGIARLLPGEAAESLGVERLELSRSDKLAIIDRAIHWWVDPEDRDVAERTVIVLRPLAQAEKSGAPSLLDHFGDVPARLRDAYGALVTRLAQGVFYDLLRYTPSARRPPIHHASTSFGVGDVDEAVRLHAEAGYRVLRHADLWP